MNSPFLTGLYAAWAVAQMAMGGLFLSAFVARRRDVEFLLFSAMCFALAVADLGAAAMYAADSAHQWITATNLTNGAAAVAVALGIHFSRAFVFGTGGRPTTLAFIYAAAILYAVIALADGWFDRSTLEVVRSSYLGMPVDQVFAEPTLLALSFYALLVPAYVWVVWLLWQATRSGRSEAKGVFAAVVLSSPLVLNDLMLAAFQVTTIYLTPVGFLMYGFGFAFALLERYERAAADLEVTASELRNATDELTISYVELSNVQEELFRRRQLASVGELAGTIAHEVRNPLAVIRNATSSLRRRAARGSDRETLLAIVDEEIDRLNGLVTELLRFARPVNIQRGDVSIAEVVDGLRQELATDHEIDLEIDEPSSDHVWVDPTLFRLALDNLVENAASAMPEGGHIAIRARVVEVSAEQSASRVDVVDTGHGMDEPTRRRAFDPFFTTRPKGTGLGLPIVRRIVEAHDGRMVIESEPGKGTTVSLLLPQRVDALGRVSTVPGQLELTE